jgi:HEAT repeat protein
MWASWTVCASLFLLQLLPGACRAAELARKETRFQGKTCREWARDLDAEAVRTRSRAATALGLGPFGKEAVPHLIKAFDDRHPEVRLSAIIALGDIGPEASPAIAGLIANLSHVHNTTTHHATVALSRMGRKAVPALIEALGSKEANVRLAVVVVLEAIGQEDDTMVRGAVAAELEVAGLHAQEFLPRLLPLLEHNNPDIRWEVKNHPSGDRSGF